MGCQDAETLPAVGHPAMFSDCVFLRSGQVGLRSWLPELYRPLSKLHRLKLQGALEEAVVVKRTKSDGTITVTLAWCRFEWVSC